MRLRMGVGLLGAGICISSNAGAECVFTSAEGLLSAAELYMKLRESPQNGPCRAVYDQAIVLVYKEEKKRAGRDASAVERGQPAQTKINPNEEGQSKQREMRRIEAACRTGIPPGSFDARIALLDARQFCGEKPCDDEVCRIVKFRTKYQLGRDAKQLREEIGNLTKELTASGVIGEAKSDGRENESANLERINAIMAAKDKLDKIRKATDEPVTEMNLLGSLDSSENPYMSFYGGVDFQTLNSAFGKGVPRIGLLAYSRFSNKLDIFGNAVLNGAGESNQPSAKTGLTKGETSTQPEKAERKLEFNINAFYRPFAFPVGQRKLHAGPLLSLGAAKRDAKSDVDPNNHFIKRRYIGLRTAYDQENFIDALVGRTSELRSWRGELRVQRAVMSFANGSHLMLGMNANFGIGKYAEQNEKDSLQIYLQWNIPFDSIWKPE